MATSPSRPGRARDRIAEDDRHPASGCTGRPPGISAAPLRRATIAGPAGMVIGWPAQRTGTPGPLEVAIGEQADQPAPPDREDQFGDRRGIAVGQHLHPEPLPEGDEVGVLGVGQLLGDGGHRHPGEAGPGSGQIPVAAVRQRDDRSGAGVRGPQHGLVDRRDPAADVIARPAGQGQHLAEVAQIGGDRAPQQIVVGRAAGQHRQVAPQGLDVGSVVPHGLPAGHRDDHGLAGRGGNRDAVRQPSR